MKKLKYEPLYASHKDFFGKKPGFLIGKFYHLFPKGGTYLDLGCGQGRDLFFMSKKGFPSFGIDNSKTAINQIKTELQNKKLKNVCVEFCNIEKFNFSSTLYDVINCSNTLQFFNKNDSNLIIKKIKNSISKNGFVLISLFTIDDPSYKNPNGKWSYFKKNELLEKFSEDFLIIHYFEGLVQDEAHGKFPPHKHGIANLIAQKI
ncbi:MAG: hypothetical protein CO140_01230 [Candidatus Moranbacteria bacterium CG_4_9_14_3_um_filter_40_7]|uniref:Methyltransferase domain-containing protein n=1 Tax=Candidatus Nealsonbacteria bacterium CG23_combo_of_CG06-09_8_20_14_all_37_18 TaxID=1974720 RepID=A0A2G9YZ21_9BACT|nr:MAG: hypothetical protein COX35_00290 [Candidatus Nealsonbacteria bacterium CG23_combo_of_CG06-09_8_20_14_all_37_18]PJA88003.1 MAG: hypothetical protein CO140_01230 [Candidatus Moranbacteria bacterium CG_4_9_14_3_um_filter_40_7]